MRNLIKIGGVLVVFGVLLFFGAHLLFAQEATPIRPTRPPQLSQKTRTQDTTLRAASDSLTAQETYVSEVILRAPWATRSLVYGGEESPPGKFGLNVYEIPDSLKEELPAPPLPEGPTSFTVAPNGDIYITDPLNERIQRFDQNGNFVSVIPIPPLEKSKYLHIQDIPEVSDSARLESLRRAGKLPKDGEVPPKPKTTNWYQWYWKAICVDQDNNVYLLWDGPNKTCVHKYDQAGKLLKTYPVLGVGGVGGAAPQIFCDSIGALFIKFAYSGKAGKFIAVFQIATATEALNEQQQKDTFRRTNMLVDGEGAIYVERILQDNTDPKHYWTLLKKYNPDGNLVATLQWEWRVGESWGPFVVHRKLVDTKGNIYVYYSTKSGISITKWYKQ